VSTASLLQFLHGATAMACFVVGLKFIKYWRLSRDRFFIFFATAFWVFAIGWGVRAFVDGGEQRHLIFVPRLLGFVLILVGIFDKNRRSANE